MANFVYFFLEHPVGSRHVTSITRSQQQITHRDRATYITAAIKLARKWAAPRP